MKDMYNFFSKYDDVKLKNKAKERETSKCSKA